MLTRHACMRVFKQAHPLLERGHEVHLITNKLSQGFERCTSVTVYNDTDQLYAAIKLHKDADVFHAHNEPSWFVTTVKDVNQRIPIVLDIHDSHLLRKTPEEDDLQQQETPETFRIGIDERNNFQLADGIVYVCDPMKKIVGEEFGLTQPNIVLPSYVPRGFYRIDFDKWLGGLVYEGRVDIPDELPKKWASFFQYSDYLELGRKCQEVGIDFHVYTTRENESVRKAYGSVSVLHQPQKYDRLIKVIGGHDWGLVGNIRPHTEWKNALPNKLFEYMAGCVPIVSINAEECSRLVDEYKVGITVGSLEELRERWSEHRECRKNVIKHRFHFAMENHIHKVEELYKEVIDATR
jgi:glycosyltransferase involved in cell wall biosynthesis